MAQVIVDHEKCNKDGICVAECPAQVLRLEKGDGFPEPTPDFDEVCLRCGHCVAVCPTGAFNLDWLNAEACPPVRAELAFTPGQAEQFLRSRRSIRVFKPEPLERAQIEQLINIACHAPSAKNMQPWAWIVIQDPSKMTELDVMLIDWVKSVIRTNPETAETMRFPRLVKIWEEGRYRMLRNAPHLIVAHVDQAWRYGVEDTALALSYIELYAPALGLGATWSGYFYTAYNAYPPLARAVPVPEGRKVVGAMMIGRPKFKYHRLPDRNPPKVEWR
jgi:nitroreductase/NAD-dependent dihydropyrimidine dehydrogenase PreA subunit